MRSGILTVFRKELLEVADDITRAYVHECWRLGVQLLSVFNASRTSMALLQDEALERRTYAHRDGPPGQSEL